MKIVYINKDGYLRSPYTRDADIPYEVSDEVEIKLREFPFNTNWRLVDGEFVLVALMTDEILKDRRQRECFDIADNRSQMWYNHLTQEQKDELNTWYEAWLDVTETKIIPNKPEWLK